MASHSGQNCQKPETAAYVYVIWLPPFHCPKPGRGSGGKVPSRRGPGVSLRENFWNCIRDLVHSDAVWWQLFVGRRTRYICNFAIKIKPICQLQCPRDCLQCFDAVGWAAGRASGLQKTERWGAGVVVCLERGADLHMAQLILLPLTVSCFSKIQIGFTSSF